MLKSVEGIYRDGKIDLTELPRDVRDDTRVIVTFLETRHLDLQARGIDEAQAAELRAQLGTFAEEWDSPDMALYDHYDAANQAITVATWSSCSSPMLLYARQKLVLP